MSIKIKLKNNLGIFVEIIKKYKVECIICAFGMVLSACLFKYIDAISIAGWSMDALDSLFRGGFSGYNDALAQNVWGCPHGATSVRNILYDPLNWLISLWNLPALLIHYIFKTDTVINMPIIVWTKCFFNLCLIISGLVCCKIVVLLTENKNRGMLTALMLWGSSTMMVSIGYSGQDEIPYMAVLLLGVYFSMKSRKNLALFFMALASFTNPAIIVFCIVIVVCSSQKILGITARICIVLLSVILKMSLMATANLNSNNNFISKYFDNATFKVGNGWVSLFAITIFSVIFMQFVLKPKDEFIRNSEMLYALSVVSFAMCTFSSLHFYRFMTCVPFLLLIIMISSNDNQMKSGLLAFLFYDFFKTIIIPIVGFKSSCFSTEWMSELFKKILNISIDSAIPLYDVIKLYLPSVDSYRSIIGGFAFACGICILIICHPSFKKDLQCRIPFRCITVAWTTLPVAFCTIYMMTFSGVGYMNNNIAALDYNAPEITGQQYLDQYFYSEKSAGKVAVKIRPVTWKKTYPEEQMLCIDLTEADTGEILKTVSCPVNQLPDNQYYQFVFDDIKMKKDKGYIFKIYSPDPIKNSDNYIYMRRSKDGTGDMNSHYAIVHNSDGSISSENWDVFSEIITLR